MFRKLGHNMAAVLPLVVSLHPLPAQELEHYTLRGSEVAIYNPAGEIRVEPGTGSAVVVEVARAGRDAEALRILTGSIEGRETLRVVVPGERVVYPGYRGESLLRVQEDGTFAKEDGRGLRIGGSGPGMDARAGLQIRIPAGKRIIIHSGVGSVSLRNLAAAAQVNSLLADVSVEGGQRSLRIKTAGGDVRLNGSMTEVEVETVIGDIQVSGFRGQRLSVRTGSGDFAAEQLRADELKVATVVGDILLAGVQAPSVRLDTGGGRIRVEGLRDLQVLEISSGTDSVTVRPPHGLGAEFRLRTTLGSIQVEVPLRDVEKSKSWFFGRSGNGSARITVTSASGHIRIARD